MNMIKFDPFRELRTINDEMNRLFGAGSTGSLDTNDLVRGAWSPRVDIFEDDNRLVVEAELPGLSRDDFEVSVENNVLTLKGERKFEKTTEGDNYHRVERSYGNFSRQFTLPQTVTSEGAAADFDNGVLRIALPKREETKARKIEVNSSPAVLEAEAKAGTATA